MLAAGKMPATVKLRSFCENAVWSCTNRKQVLSMDPAPVAAVHLSPPRQAANQSAEMDAIDLIEEILQMTKNFYT